MSDIKMKTDFDIKDFFQKLYDMHCISRVWEKVLDVLKNLETGISDQALAIFSIYFSQLDDGNICIPLDDKLLTEKWNKKWEGLLLIENLSGEQKEDSAYFSKIIKEGLSSLNSKSLPDLISDAAVNPEETEPDYSKPFIIDDGWLFAAKYYKAKLSIEKNIKKILKPENIKISDSQMSEIREYFKNLTSGDGKKTITLKDEQIEAIIRGEKENLIITGGPGTGKTTVVCYLLWKLLLTGDYLDYSLYLAAPSGKAADRMKESISDTLSNLNISNLPADQQASCKTVFEKLNSANSSTIHRLLSFNPATNGFRYNAKNQFEEKAIFIIDEASMIDITLFSSLLESIPQGARVFILGDKDQLPSVQAGAVLGELLANKKDSVAALKESSRFNDNSDVGRLKNAMQEERPLDKELAFFTQWDNWKENNNFADIPEGAFPVTTFIPQINYNSRKIQIEEIIDCWTRAFYSDLIQQASGVFKKAEQSAFDELWLAASKARILCAERKGLQGVETINNYICSRIQKAADETADNDYFTGQLLMLTKNQSLFCLYNGDSGIVVEHNKLKYLMVKKEIKENSESEVQTSNNYRALVKQGIFQQGSYIFYPLHLLPKESIETAYAITIHKSQGSGYKAILVLLPEQVGHPLLNRQIAYTAITRTEGSTYIVADYETLEAARSTVIQRDTRIEL